MLLKAMGAALAPSVILMILSAVAGFVLAVTTPAGPGQEMGGGFVFPAVLFVGIILSIIVYIVSCVVFWIWGTSPKLFWWVTLTPNTLFLLLAGLLLLLNIMA